MAMFRKDSRALDALFSDEQGIDPTAIVEKQMTGHMYKCSLDGSRRWKRRFFVLKDGFLMYYEPREKRLVFFDFHPKGVLPLDGVELATVQLEDGPKANGRKVVHGISITHPSFGGRALHLAVEEEAMRNTWMAALEASRHVTYKNAVTGSTSVDMYKDMATHAQTRMGKMSSDLIAAKKQAKTLAATLAAKNEYIVNLLTTIASASAKHGVHIPVPEAPAAAPASSAAAAAGGAGAEDTHADDASDSDGEGEGRGVRFAAAEAAAGLTLDLKDKETAGELSPQHGGSPGRTPAPKDGLTPAFPASEGGEGAAGEASEPGEAAGGQDSKEDSAPSEDAPPRTEATQDGKAGEADEAS